MKKLFQILNIVVFGAMVYVNYLSNALPINGRTPAEISDSFPNLFVPAGITFSIWGVIYLLLLGFVIYQAKDLFKSSPDATPWFSKVGILFVLTCLFNMAWIYSWHYGYVPHSVGIMLALLLFLISINNNLNKVRYQMSKTEQWLVALPFSVYMGWITVALIANVTAFLVSIGWDGFGVSEYAWAIGMIMVATFIAQTVVSRRGDIAYGLVLIWAFAGIIIKQGGFESNVSIAAAIGIGLLSLVVVPLMWKKVF